MTEPLSSTKLIEIVQNLSEADSVISGRNILIKLKYHHYHSQSDEQRSQQHYTFPGHTIQFQDILYISSTYYTLPGPTIQFQDLLSTSHTVPGAAERSPEPSVPGSDKSLLLVQTNTTGHLSEEISRKSGKTNTNGSFVVNNLLAWFGKKMYPSRWSLVTVM